MKSPGSRTEGFTETRSACHTSVPSSERAAGARAAAGFGSTRLGSAARGSGFGSAALGSDFGSAALGSDLGSAALGSGVGSGAFGSGAQGSSAGLRSARGSVLGRVATENVAAGSLGSSRFGGSGAARDLVDGGGGRRAFAAEGARDTADGGGGRDLACRGNAVSGGAVLACAGVADGEGGGGGGVRDGDGGGGGIDGGGREGIGAGAGAASSCSALASSAAVRARRTARKSFSACSAASAARRNQRTASCLSPIPQSVLAVSSAIATSSASSGSGAGISVLRSATRNPCVASGPRTRNKKLRIGKIASVHLVAPRSSSRARASRFPGSSRMALVANVLAFVLSPARRAIRPRW